MARARLNCKQKAWVEKFLSDRPDAEVKEIVPGLAGDRIVKIVWSETIEPPNVADCDRGLSWRSHELTVKLRKFGDPRSIRSMAFRDRLSALPSRIETLPIFRAIIIFRSKSC